MLFSSITFLFYFLPAVLFVYYLCFWSKPVQNVLLLLVSLFFYAWGEPVYVWLMIGTILFNYCFGGIIHHLREHKEIKKYCLFFAIVGNLGILFMFKYAEFFAQTINRSLSMTHQIKVPNLVLPIGISFFTFQAMSYVIDVYLGKVEVQKNPFYLGLYVSFFPQLVAGPIVRYGSIEEQIRTRKETVEKFSVGSCRFIIGLSKKVLLANTLAGIADHIFAMQQQGAIAVTLAWLGAIAYTLQIYYDFSGYSDMAIGLSLLFGFKLEENFNYPYISKSISEFWRRWHISLGSWFKDYVYIPLGGSHVRNKDMMIRNLFIVWLLTGLWHGAGWTFLFWGVLNFVMIFFEKLLSFDRWRVKPIYQHIYCMFFVILGWVLFRSVDLIQAGAYIRTMFGIGCAGFLSDTAFMFVKENIVFLLAGILFAFPVARKTNAYVAKKRPGHMVFELLYPIVIPALFVVCVCYLVKGTYNPFIYYNF